MDDLALRERMREVIAQLVDQILVRNRGTQERRASAIRVLPKDLVGLDPVGKYHCGRTLAEQLLDGLDESSVTELGQIGQLRVADHLKSVGVDAVQGADQGLAGKFRVIAPNRRGSCGSGVSHPSRERGAVCRMSDCRLSGMGLQAEGGPQVEEAHMIA